MKIKQKTLENSLEKVQETQVPLHNGDGQPTTLLSAG